MASASAGMPAFFWFGDRVRMVTGYDVSRRAGMTGRPRASTPATVMRGSELVNVRHISREVGRRFIDGVSFVLRGIVEALMHSTEPHKRE